MLEAATRAHSINPLEPTDTSLNVPETDHLKPYVKERLALIKPKPEIMPTDLDIDFMLAMELKNGVHACLQYLRGFQHIPRHANVIMLPVRYSKHLSDFILDQQIRSGVYFTPNGFKYHSAKKADFLTVKSAYLDIDFPKDVFITTDQRVALTKLVLDEANLPFPTAIVNSGHGLHLYYIFKEEVYDNTADKQFARMLERIHSEFVRRFNVSVPLVTDQTMKADSAATNANRKLRLPASWNGDQIVHCVEFHADHFVDFTYLFSEYMPAYDPLKVKRAKEARDTPKSKKVTRFTTPNALNVSRVNDLLTLLKLRNYNLPDMRNEFMHILSAQYNLHALDNWEPEIHRVNDLLTDPLTLREVEGIIKSVKRGKYRYKNKTIITKLAITSDELKHMIMNEITAREVRENKRQARRDKKKQRDAQIVKLFQSGVSKAEIARHVGTSRPTVHKVITNHEKRC